MLEGLVDQAWVRLGGLEVGVQPSVFGFDRWGYSITPGYSSELNTPAISYTYRVDDIGSAGNSASASVAVEDPSRRDMADGVLAQYAATRLPISSLRRAMERRPSCSTSAARCMKSATKPPAIAALRPSTRRGAARRRSAANIASNGATSSANPPETCMGAS